MGDVLDLTDQEWLDLASTVLSEAPGRVVVSGVEVEVSGSLAGVKVDGVRVGDTAMAEVLAASPAFREKVTAIAVESGATEV